MTLLLQPISVALRQALKRITESELDASQHPRLVNDLRSVHPHTIEVAVDPEVAHIPLHWYKCYHYALRLAESAAVAKISWMLDRTTWLNGEFMESLIVHHLHGVPSGDGQDGDVIVYSDEREIVHAGIVTAERVRSKWGDGHLWWHAALEVPLHYGSIVRLYRPIEPTVSEQAFITYAKEREGAELVENILEMLWPPKDRSVRQKRALSEQCRREDHYGCPRDYCIGPVSYRCVCACGHRTSRRGGGRLQ